MISSKPGAFQFGYYCLEGYYGNASESIQSQRSLDFVPAQRKTKRDGPAIGFGLMDAASCFMLSAKFFPGTDNSALYPNNFQELLKQAWTHKKEYPIKLFVPSEILDCNLEAVVQSRGISMAHVPEDQLLVFIGEAQVEFRKQFG